MLGEMTIPVLPPSASTSGQRPVVHFAAALPEGRGVTLCGRRFTTLTSDPDLSVWAVIPADSLERRRAHGGLCARCERSAS